MKSKFSEKHAFPACLLSGFVVLLCLILLASVPPVSRDALTHHLIIPKLYLNHGGIFEIPYIEFSYYPMNLQLLYMIPLYFGNDIIPKYIHLAFAVFTAGLIFYYLKKKINKNWGILGAFIFLTIPVITKLCTIVYVDLGLIFFSTASIIQLLKWRDNNFTLKYLIYASIFCGLALGTKYNGLITFFILSIIVVFLYSRSKPSTFANQLSTLKYGSLFIGLSLLFFSPWMIKNFIWTGNIIYPLYDGILNFKSGPDVANTAAVSVTEMSKGWGHFAIRKVIFGEKWWEILLIPIRIFFQGVDNNPKYFDGVLNPFLLILPLFTLGKKRKWFQKGLSDEQILLLFSWLFILIVFLKQDMRIRWIGPAIPPLLILSILGLKNIYDICPQKKYWKVFIVLICTVMASLNINYLIGQFEYIKPFDYLTGKVTRIEYIKRYRPEFSTINYANKHLGQHTQILALFLGNRRYYSDHKMICNEDLFKSIIKQSKRIEDIVYSLKQDGITHIIINYGLFNQWAEKQFSNKEKVLVGEFFTKVGLMYAKDGFGLYGFAEGSR